MLPLLPDQKNEAQGASARWSSSPLIGYLSLELLGSTFFYSVSLTFLAMFPATSCLHIVGGEGPKCGNIAHGQRPLRLDTTAVADRAVMR